MDTDVQEMTLRPEVRRFAFLMELQLRKHDAIRGATGWKGDSAMDLYLHMTEELDEVAIALRDKTPVDVAQECADVGNMAMMVADVTGALMLGAATHGPEFGGDITEIRERLAAYAHSAWSGWMHYMFGKAVRKQNGTVVLPASLVTRWERQASTTYEALPGSEQWSDQVEADKMLALLGRQYAAKRVQCIRCGMESSVLDAGWRFNGVLWEHHCPDLGLENQYGGVGVPTASYDTMTYRPMSAADWEQRVVEATRDEPRGKSEVGAVYERFQLTVGDDAPFEGLCDRCGDVVRMDGSWRYVDGVYQHKCRDLDPQVGHVGRAVKHGGMESGGIL